MEEGHDSPTPEQIGAELSGAAKVEVAHPVPTRAYLFLSFDLVNSTIFKQQNEGWQSQISQFYSNAEHAVGTRIENANIWKFAGDEVLFWVSPKDATELFGTVEKAYEVLQWLDSRTSTESHEKLRVKGTCWIALANPQASPTQARNIIFTHTSDAVTNARDFLGPEIDAGFRLGQHTLQGTLAVSAELAAFLAKYAPMPLTEHLRLVTFLTLKGVWTNRFYPICWFRKRFDDFKYDDKYEHPLLMKALNAKVEDLKELATIVESMQPGYVAGLAEALRVGEPDVIVRAPQLEVHGVAVCRRDDGRVLVAKRPQSKKSHKGKWEFGCAQLRAGESFEEAIRRDYLSAFGASVSDLDAVNPLSTYAFQRDGRTIPGVIMAARVTNPDGCKATKHDAIEWIDPANVPSHVGTNAVPDLQAVLAKLAAR